jgi:anti-sigma factor RsiW
MKPQNPHAHEDRLLDFAYGELSPQDTRAVQSHLEGCPKCSEALASIRGVRSAFSQLGMEPAPEAGLESLLAYAQQSVRHNAQAPSPKQSLWRRLTVPVMGIAAVSVFGLVTLRVNERVNLQPEFSAQLQKTAAPVAETALPPSAELALPSAPPAAGAAAEPQPSRARREQDWDVLESKKKMEKGNWAKVSRGSLPAAKAKEAQVPREDEGESLAMAADDAFAPPPPAPAATAEPMPAQPEAAAAKPAPYERDEAYGAAAPSGALRLSESRSRRSKGKDMEIGAGPSKQAPSETERSQQATVARQDGKRVLEASLLREALADGATGEERWSLLARLCDAEFALGRREAAIEACSLVLKEAPGSPAGLQARRRLAQEAPSVLPAQPGTGSAAPAPAP